MSRELGNDSSIDQDLVDRRENPRYGMQVRVSVLGVDDRTTLHNETTETIDISAKGIRLLIGYPVHPGNHTYHHSPKLVIAYISGRIDA